ncbi:cation:dicarboxylate symporter family transporter [Corynebacterium ramonii]|uniref:Aerobic C4-dicarboxylate transport protein n=1 Tax=Corynebacterium ramonii TaxID=3026968 RepID=A0ABN4EJF8_9CORY|nr:cation:dicarboxylase symporter family transporter [Corynebacterium ramonii]AIU33438.1 Aerobic C4-dicarboxylate transport protein [Corynebacterium ramonii FRC0011]
MAEPHLGENSPLLPAREPQIAESKTPKDRTHWLYIAVIIAVVAGIAFGLIVPDLAKNFKVIGTMFVSLIKMMISPVIFCTIVLGIGSVRAAASVGKAGGLALTYFIIMSTFALAVGLLVGNLIEPGSGLDIEATAGEGAAFADKAEHGTGLVGFIQSIIPETAFSSLTSGSVLQTLFVALLAGFAVQGMGKAGEPILRGIAHLQKLVFKMLTMILWVAPIGAFGAIAGVVGATGFEAVKQLAILMLAFYITCVLFIFVVLGIILRIGAGFNIWKLLKYLGRELLLIVATSSSESALPNLMRKMEHVGVDKSTVGIVVPTGYSFNLDGTAIYLTMSAIFISDAMNKPLTLGEQIGLLVFMIIASKGAAGVSGAGIATLAAGLHSHRPELLDGVGVIVGIDRFMSEARALTNFSGNAVATILVGRWTNTLDVQRAHDVLDGKIPYVESADDSDVHFSNPTVTNPAHATLQPTPQVDLTRYQK